ncbi:hypothetical protein TruAng_012066 [Truncatella angustata]|nr:hypothetical protein TruAng_012066 [Truncatella angustata]
MNCPIERRDHRSQYWYYSLRAIEYETTPDRELSATQKDYKRRTGTLDPKACTVACIASVEIEAQAALHMLDGRQPGGSPWAEVTTMCSTQSTGQDRWLRFPNIWFGLPDLSRRPARDIRLGDVLVCLPDGESAGLDAYDLGKETEDVFEPLRHGRALAMAELIIRSAIGGTKLKSPKDAQILCRTTKPSARRVADRARRPDSRRIRVWDGPIRSCEKLLKNLQRRNELRDRRSDPSEQRAVGKAEESNQCSADRAITSNLPKRHEMLAG